MRKKDISPYPYDSKFSPTHLHALSLPKMKFDLINKGDMEYKIN